MVGYCLSNTNNTTKRWPLEGNTTHNRHVREHQTSEVRTIRRRVGDRAGRSMLCSPLSDSVMAVRHLVVTEGPWQGKSVQSPAEGRWEWSVVNVRGVRRPLIVFELLNA